MRPLGWVRLRLPALSRTGQWASWFPLRPVPAMLLMSTWSFRKTLHSGPKKRELVRTTPAWVHFATKLVTGLQAWSSNVLLRCIPPRFALLARDQPIGRTRSGQLAQQSTNTAFYG